MLVVGGVLFPVFLVFEWRIPAKPVVPMRWLRRGPILGACLIGFFDFVSFYLQYTYLYRCAFHLRPDHLSHHHSYVSITQNWSYANITYFSATQSLALTIFAILAGGIMYVTRRFKVSYICASIAMHAAESNSSTCYSLAFSSAF